jgi:hypothetical protein
VKTTIRIAALMLLIVLSAHPSNTGGQSSRFCICPDVIDPHCDATGRTFGNGCLCRCYSTQPGTCTRCAN